MFAVISDIHSNVEALQAVLDDIRARGVERIVCLGDVVGYGPDPLPCLDLVRGHCAVTLCGNHDQAVLLEPNNFNVGAEQASFWTRQCLEGEPEVTLRNERWDFLGGLPIRQVEGATLFVHGSPRRPVNEYIFSDEVFANPTKMAHIFERIPGTCFVGHTHVPGVFTPEPDFYEPIDEKLQTLFPDHIRLRITGDRQYKVGYAAAHVLGRMGYYNQLGDDLAYLVVRNFFNNPSLTYAEEPADAPGTRGHSIHVYNDDGNLGGFGEMECNAQTIGGETGRSTSNDQLVLWLYVGVPDRLKEIGLHLLGIEI